MNVKVLESKPSLLSLVSQNQMRLSLKRITEMPEAERKRYASRIMPTYSDPLREVGFDEDSFGYRVSEIILCAVNQAVFERG
jgi:hypothetical protein